MNYYWKEVSQYIELAWDKRTNAVHDFIVWLVWLNLYNII